MSSLKTNLQIFSSPWSLPSKLSFDNYVYAWKTAKVGVYTLNSIYLTTASLVVGLVLAIPAVYPIARLKTRISGALYLYFLFGVILPVNSLLIPLFVTYSRLGLVDTRFGLLLFYTATNIPFNIFILYGFLLSVPVELEESAVMDGAPISRIILQITVPIMKPAIATAAVLSFLNKWNELIYALTFLSSFEKRTLPAGLTYFSDMFTTDYGGMLAGIVMSVVPIIVFYVLMQKNVVAGLTAGAVKA